MATPTQSSNTKTFLNNLKVLGFEPEVHCKGTNISLNEGIFTNNANNVKAFEIISHFLFRALDKEKTRKSFHGIWPTNTRDKSREYLDIALSWLQEIKDKTDSPLKNIPLRKSNFVVCRGEKMNQIFLAFSTYVLHHVLLNKENIALTSLKDMNISTLQSKIQSLSSKFIQQEATTKAVKRTWSESADNIMSRLLEPLPVISKKPRQQIDLSEPLDQLDDGLEQAKTKLKEQTYEKQLRQQEQQRMEAERHLQEQQRLAGAERLEESRIADVRQMVEQKLAYEKELVKQKRLETEQKRAAEEQRLLAIRKKLQEERLELKKKFNEERIANQTILAEQKRVEEEDRLKGQRKAEEEQKRSEAEMALRDERLEAEKELVQEEQLSLEEAEKQRKSTEEATLLQQQTNKEHKLQQMYQELGQQQHLDEKELKEAEKLVKDNENSRKEEIAEIDYMKQEIQDKIERLEKQWNQDTDKSLARHNVRLATIRSRQAEELEEQKEQEALMHQFQKNEKQDLQLKYENGQYTYEQAIEIKKTLKERHEKEDEDFKWQVLRKERKHEVEINEEDEKYLLEMEALTGPEMELKEELENEIVKLDHIKQQAIEKHLYDARKEAEMYESIKLKLDHLKIQRLHQMESIRRQQEELQSTQETERPEEIKRENEQARLKELELKMEAERQEDIERVALMKQNEPEHQIFKTIHKSARLKKNIQEEYLISSNRQDTNDYVEAEYKKMELMKFNTIHEKLVYIFNLPLRDNPAFYLPHNLPEIGPEDLQVDTVEPIASKPDTPILVASPQRNRMIRGIDDDYIDDDCLVGLESVVSLRWEQPPWTPMAMLNTPQHP